MAKFASPQKQAASVMKAMQGTVLRSVGTVRNYEQALVRVTEWCQQERIAGGLRGLTTTQAYSYLEQRGQTVGQSTLNMERQAVQAMMQHVTGKLEAGERLTVIKSEHQQVLGSRAYTGAQVALIAAAQTEKNSLATEIAHAAGLRAHELATLQRIEERPPNERPSLPSKFQGQEGVRYTVQGKGGLIREVNIPHALSTRLEASRIAPEWVTDRGIHYERNYNIGHGNTWSSSFTTASQRVLNWSAGAHGLRHSYAQDRMSELQRAGLTRDTALETVSQEMGHFRAEITEVYLR